MVSEPLTITLRISLKLKLSGLYSNLFVIIFSLVFHKTFCGGGKQKRAPKICATPFYKDPRLQESQNFAFLTRILQECQRIANFARLVHTLHFLQNSGKNNVNFASFVQKFYSCFRSRFQRERGFLLENS